MSEPIVTTVEGRVRGSSQGGVARFLGVPYAAPPYGARRFAPPAPYPAWTAERDATSPGPNAPQMSRPFPGLDLTALVRPGWQRGDDFLSLNVWKPDGEVGALPVMVFIHGGAFVVGDKDAPVQDGAGFARSGVVCIAINYRMGVEGFLPIPGAPTNLGLRDQVAALEWVRRNAAAFGGDPANVTVFGESAGAMSVANLVASPATTGLFRRAIVQSGHGAMVRPLDVAERVTRKLAKILRITPDVAGFRSRTVEECLAALDTVSRPFARVDLRDEHGREPSFGLSRFLPVFGDDILPRRPVEALADGVGAGVDLLIGTNREEMNLYLVPTGLGRGIAALFARYFLGRCEPRTGEILKAYGREREGKSSGEAFAAAATDLVFRLAARRFAAAHRGRTHFYEFGWRSPACGGNLGACHAIEMPFVFDTLPVCTGEKAFAGPNPPQELADRVHGVWARFATDGTLPWPEFDGSTRQVYALEIATAASEPEPIAARYLP
jgi:para-nitrobenzyl esterase